MKRKFNNKVRNATKVVIDGIQFDSKLEGYCYTLLRDNNIEFDIKQEVISVPGFTHLGKKYLPVKNEPDFILKKMNIIIETKGFANDVYPIKKKLLLKHYADKGIPMQIFNPSSQTEVRELIGNILLGNPFISPKKKRKKGALKIK